MTPEEMAAQIGARVGRDVRPRPDLHAAPWRWLVPVAGSQMAASVAAAEVSGAAADGDRVVVTLTDANVREAVERAAQVPFDRTDGALERTIGPIEGRGRALVLTRDGRREVSYAALAEEVGVDAARWAVLRMSDSHQIDCAASDLATLTLRNPIFPVLLAVSRLETFGGGSDPGGVVAALTAEWPLVVADTRRTGRTRPLALHVEALAGAVLDWWERGQGGLDATLVPWTGERLARAARIVLRAGLAVADVRAPARI
ncbi:hypothetical protein [Demetria terragena]|uniref:hypothetical protein n=1 Tax=Demetria terragena TaxID=63959 RepID=UPI00035CE51D|nr:hypothetical protein [Demetria terragena]